MIKNQNQKIMKKNQIRIKNRIKNQIRIKNRIKNQDKKIKIKNQNRKRGNEIWER
jgi:hypothetical protein